MRSFIRRYPYVWIGITFLVWGFPQWLASIWSLFSPNPIAKVLSESLRKHSIRLPHVSAYWVTTPIAFAMFIAVWREVKRRPLPGPSPTIEQLGDQELHEQSAQWLIKRFSDTKMNVERAILFGSIVHDHFSTADVDLIVVIKEISYRKSTAAGRRVKGLRADFKARFNHALHLQVYFASEKNRLTRFLSGLGKYEELKLRM